MKQDENKHSSLTEEMKKACCNTCLLAEKMKDCQNCPFNKYKISNPVLSKS